MLAKKSLGQNFLKSGSALSKIIETARIKKGDFVLEIGPGRGALTKKLLAAGAKVLAIEKDSELVQFLNNEFKTEVNNNQLVILNEDILKFDESKIQEHYKLVANIPYYITGLIIRKFLTSNNQPELAVLLVQKEVAERIVSKNRPASSKNTNTKESLLSISVKVYANPKLIKVVKAGSFSPAPKVDSAIILLENLNKEMFVSNQIKEEDFFNLLHAGFAHKRKVLRKNLEEFATKYSIDKSKIISGIKEIDKPDSVRSENLNLSDWVCLISHLLR